MPKTATCIAGWTTVAFGDVVRLSTERSSNPESAGFERFVGLEHIEPGALRIRRWGDIADGTTFTSVFRPGQVLFGKRRAYQRKVAVADFSGVCSGDIYILEPKGKNLLPELLPFICQTDAFFEHAVKTSAGSLSPRTNWKNLASFEFALPPIGAQQRITAVLANAARVADALDALRHQARRCHRAYVDGRLSFGANQSGFTNHRPSLRQGWRYVHIEDLCQQVVDCLHRTPSYQEHGYPAIRTEDVSPGYLSWEGAFRVSEEDYQLQISRLAPQEGDVLFSREGGRLGMAALVPPDVLLCISQRMMHLRARDGIPASLVMEYLNSSWVQRQVRMLIGGSASPHLNVSDIRRFLVPLPPNEELPNFAKRAAMLLSSEADVQARAVKARDFASRLIEFACAGRWEALA